MRERISEAVNAYIGARFVALGKPIAALDPSSDLFEDRVLDSVALTGLIAAVEKAVGREIYFIDVDPDKLGTIAGIVDELARVLDPAV